MSEELTMDCPYAQFHPDAVTIPVTFCFLRLALRNLWKERFLTTSEERVNRIHENEKHKDCINVLIANVPVMIGDLLRSAFADVSYITVFDHEEDALRGPDVKPKVAVDVILCGSARRDGRSECIDVLGSLLARYENAKAIVLMQDPDCETAVALLRAGAKGIFCTKNLRFALLCKSVGCVYKGQIWADNDIVRYLVDSMSRPQLREVTDSQGRKLLTPREQQVLHLLSDGLSNFQLAAELKLSEHTVKNHLFRIYEKLGVSTRMEAVLYALTPRTIQPMRMATREVRSNTIRIIKAG